MSNGNDYQWEQPEDMNTGGGNFLKTAGTFHVTCHGASTLDKDDNPIDGFDVNIEVLDGTVRDSKGGTCTEIGKLAHIRFYNGKLNGKDGGKFARQKQAALFVAANILGPSDIPSLLERKPRIDLSKAQSQQFIITVELGDKGWPQLNYANVFHVDDPAAKAFPKDEAALKLLPKHLRRTPEELQAIKDAFAGKSPGTGGSNGHVNGSSNGGGGGQSHQPVGAGAGVDLDDI